VRPGQSVRYEAEIERADEAGAAAGGVISRWDHRDGVWAEIGRVDLVFSHLDHNRAGHRFPDENFVFGDNFRTILRGTGLDRLA
jgi:hypothetical protein